MIDAQGVVRHLKVQPLSIFRQRDEEIIAAIRAAGGRRSDVFDEERHS